MSKASNRKSCSGLVQNVLTEFRHLESDVSQQAFKLLLDCGYQLMVKADDSSGIGGDSALVVTSLKEPKRILHRLAMHPLIDPSRSFANKAKSWLLSSFITDLWYALASDTNVDD